jgi:ankyrin repeat protein
MVRTVLIGIPVALLITVSALAQTASQPSVRNAQTFRDPAAARLKDAILSGNLDVVQRIVSAAPLSDCLEVDEQGRTALQYAVQRCATDTSADAQPFEILKILVGRDHCADAADRLGRKPILELVPLSWDDRSRMDALHILLSHGADINAQDENGGTLLHQVLSSWDASSLHWPELIGILGQGKLNPNIVNSTGQSPLHALFGPQSFYTNREGDRTAKITVAHKVLKMLEEMGAKLSIRDNDGTTPIGEMLAAYEPLSANKSMILSFATPSLSNQLQISSAFVKNRPALLFLCDKHRSDPDLVQRVLELGADANVAEQNGFTSLHGAAWFYNYRVCALLLARGATVNATNGRGQTALHIIARSTYHSSNNLEIDPYANVMRTAALLIASGADKRLKDADGKRPIDLLKTQDESDGDVQDLVRALKKLLKP